MGTRSEVKPGWHQRYAGADLRPVRSGVRFLAAGPQNTALELHFGDGTVVAWAELYALAANSDGQTLEGTAGDDVLIGTAGDDLLIGGRGNDTMDGAGGDDIFLVEGRRQGKDRIIGGAGYDTISGGDGDDRITLTELLASDGLNLSMAARGEYGSRYGRS